MIKKEACRSVNVGYLFLKDIYYDLKIHDICTQIAEKYKFEFDLNQILSMLLFSRIIYPGSKRSSLELSKQFLEKPDCKLHHVYRALEILAKENDFFQSQLYKNSEMVLNRHKRVLYYAALTITSRLRKRMISENMAIPKKTVRTRLYRWGYLWMLMGFHSPSPSLTETRMNNLR